MNTGQLLYHRINKHEAERRLQELQAAGPLPPDSPATPVDLVSASPRATGGVPVTQQHLQLLRTRTSEVIAELDGLGANQASAEFDRRISAVLWDTLDIVPAGDVHGGLVVPRTGGPSRNGGVAVPSEHRGTACWFAPPPCTASSVVPSPGPGRSAGRLNQPPGRGRTSGPHRAHDFRLRPTAC